MSTKLNTAARRIFNKLSEDISDRRGLKQEWSAISPNVMKLEIRRAWEQIITEEVEKHTSKLQTRVKRLEDMLSYAVNGASDAFDKAGIKPGEFVDRAKAAADRIKRLEEALTAYQEAYTPDGHIAPHDCFSTGPKTGDFFQDHVWCPGCYAASKAKESKP